MMKVFENEPWLILTILPFIVGAIALVVGARNKTELARIDAALKSEMIARGMSPEQIVMVLAARSRPAEEE